MLEILCAICQKPYHPRDPKEWFCSKCYQTWQEAIRNNEPWVKVCVNSEAVRRHSESKWIKKRITFITGLGTEFDVVQDGGGFKIVLLKNKDDLED